MEDNELNKEIIARGRQFFSRIQHEKPSLFNKEAWTGRVMDWSMRNEYFKIQLFRFIDVFPSLKRGRLLAKHIHEYFGRGKSIPMVLYWGARASKMLGALGGSVLNRFISMNIRAMARQFIIGESPADAVKNIEKLRAAGFAFVIDVLGEATVSEDEAESYVRTYQKLLDTLKKLCARWKPLGGGSDAACLDWGHSPIINVSVKPTALYCLANPMDFDGSVDAILGRLRRICEKVMEVNGFLCIDMESYRFKDISLEVYRRIKLEFPDYPHIGIVLQAYLKDTEKDIKGFIEWAGSQGIPISVRLVKGAYWDYETVSARLNGWDPPVLTRKAETDAAYERLARLMLENHDVCHMAFATHNIRTIASVLETARSLGVPEERYEFQLLYGMAEPVRKVILSETRRVRLYCPFGDMVPGMGYLVRRLLENTSNDSFLRRRFSERASVEQLLEDPVDTLSRERSLRAEAPEGIPDKTGLVTPFVNEPAVDFTRREFRRAFPAAIAAIRKKPVKNYPLYIGGRNMSTHNRVPSVNPADPEEVLGYVCQAGVKEAEKAIACAAGAFPAWRDMPVRKRVGYLVRAASEARSRIFELAAWQVLEIGKQWDQAYADVTEAIDFFEYYARQMVRYGSPRQAGSPAGESNLYCYEPRGVAAVIAPWNFPLAISAGMTSAAVAAGNTVVYKPSSITGIVGHQLVELFRSAKLPRGVFNYIPGRGHEIGDMLVDHPQISLIAFTGSMEVGHRIIGRASKVHPGQAYIKRVVAEMGGKNAIIIDEDADLDEAVPHVLYSAFGFQGQKCSACSRVIVLKGIYNTFVERLVAAARAFTVGPAENPAHTMGPVCDGAAVKIIREFIEIGRREGRVIYESPVPDNGGFYVPMTIIDGVRPEHRIAQEEIFGPVLSVMRVKDFDQAIEWALSTRYALTGGIFSRSPGNLERARREFRVGNLYINRQITGALVERQAFGGSRMSGVGTKAGGPDYLLHFMDPRVVTENTLRRGFAPGKGSGGDSQ